MILGTKLAKYSGYVYLLHSPLSKKWNNTDKHFSKQFWDWDTSVRRAIGGLCLCLIFGSASTQRGHLGPGSGGYLDVFVIMDPRPECPGHAGLYGDQWPLCGPDTHIPPPWDSGTLLTLTITSHQSVSVGLKWTGAELVPWFINELLWNVSSSIPV